MNNEQISKLVTEALGGCWHEWNMYLGPGYAPTHYLCIKCGTSCYRPAQDAPNIDYATDERACVALITHMQDHIDVEHGGCRQSIAVHIPTFEPWPWIIEMSWHGKVEALTFCLAICKAFLKSKDIELEDE